MILMMKMVIMMMMMRCAFVILVMAVYWVTECIPLPVTALLPIVLFPLLKIMSTDDVCITYFKESNMMFIGTLLFLQLTFLFHTFTPHLNIDIIFIVGDKHFVKVLNLIEP